MGIVLNFLVILLKNQCIFVMENKNIINPQYGKSITDT